MNVNIGSMERFGKVHPPLSPLQVVAEQAKHSANLKNSSLGNSEIGVSNHLKCIVYALETTRHKIMSEITGLVIERFGVLDEFHERLH